MGTTPPPRPIPPPYQKPSPTPPPPPPKWSDTRRPEPAARRTQSSIFSPGSFLLGYLFGESE